MKYKFLLPIIIAVIAFYLILALQCTTPTDQSDPYVRVTPGWTPFSTDGPTGTPTPAASPIPTAIAGVNVYIGGYNENGTGTNAVKYPVIWHKNGTEAVTELKLSHQNSSYHSEVLDVFVHNDNVYAAGYFSASGMGSDSVKISRIWVNGVQIPAPSTNTADDYLNSLYVDDTYIYAAGRFNFHTDNQDTSRGKYTGHIRIVELADALDGVSTYRYDHYFDENKKNAEITGITAVGGVPHIVGSYEDTSGNRQAFYATMNITDDKTATFNITNLSHDTDASLSTWATSVYYENNKAYVSGYYEDTSNVYHACYWEVSSTGVQIHYKEATYSVANSVIVDTSDDTVYYAGYKYVDSKYTGKYWSATDKEFTVAGDDGTNANAITQSSAGDIYVVGTYGPDTESQNACYWKGDDAKVDLQGSDEESVATSIFIYEK